MRKKWKSLEFIKKATKLEIFNGGKNGGGSKKKSIGRAIRSVTVLLVAAGLLAGSWQAYDKTGVGTRMQIDQAQQKSPTSYNAYIAQFQAEAVDMNPNRKIVIVDSEYVDQVMSTSAYLGFPVTRQQALLEDVRRKSGVMLNPYIADMLEEAIAGQRAPAGLDKLSLEREMLREMTEFRPVANDLIKGGEPLYANEPSARVWEEDWGAILDGQGKNQVCLLVPKGPDLNALEDNASMVGVPEAAFRFLDLDGTPLAMTTEQVRLYIDQHELGHCLDNEKMAQLGKARGVDGYWVRHLSESFADARSVLELAQRGYEKTGRMIADLRATRSIVTGPQRAALPEQYGWARYASGVYYTSPSVEAAQAYIDAQGLDAIAAMSEAEITALAHKIVDENAMTRVQFEDLFQLFKQGGAYLAALEAEGTRTVEPAEEGAEPTTELDPEFAARIDFLKGYVNNGNAAIDRTVDRVKLKELYEKGITRGGPGVWEAFQAQMEEPQVWASIKARAEASGGMAYDYMREISAFRDMVRADVAAGKEVRLSHRLLAARAGLYLSMEKKSYNWPPTVEKILSRFMPQKQDNLPENEASQSEGPQTAFPPRF